MSFLDPGEEGGSRCYRRLASPRPIFGLSEVLVTEGPSLLGSDSPCGWSLLGKGKAYGIRKISLYFQEVKIRLRASASTGHTNRGHAGLWIGRAWSRVAFCDIAEADECDDAWASCEYTCQRNYATQQRAINDSCDDWYTMYCWGQHDEWSKAAKQEYQECSAGCEEERQACEGAKEAPVPSPPGDCWIISAAGGGAPPLGTEVAESLSVGPSDQSNSSVIC